MYQGTTTPGIPPPHNLLPAKARRGKPTKNQQLHSSKERRQQSNDSSSTCYDSNLTPTAAPANASKHSSLSNLLKQIHTTPNEPNQQHETD